MFACNWNLFPNHMGYMGGPGFGMFLNFGLLMVGIYLLFKLTQHITSKQPQYCQNPTPEEIVKYKLARGDISEEEYKRVMKIIKH